METIKFYKDVNNLWVLGDYASIAVRSVNLIKYADETINFEKNGSAMFYPNLKISQLVNASNEKYVADGTDFDEAINILKSATSDFFADAPALTGADLSTSFNETETGKAADATVSKILNDKITSLESGLLGTIAYNAPAPTPAKSGYYEFSSSGACSWITGTPIVSVQDRVYVLFTAPSTYVYTHVSNPMKTVSFSQLPQGFNLINPATITDAKYISSNAGALGSSTFSFTTDFIAWGTQNVIRCKRDNNVATGFSYSLQYDANYNPIANSYQSTTLSSIVKYTGAVYIRITLFVYNDVSWKNPLRWMLFFGMDTSVNFEPYYKLSDADSLGYKASFYSKNAEIKTVIRTVKRFGTSGVDADYCGVNAIGDCLASITDASYYKRYKIVVDGVFIFTDPATITYLDPIYSSPSVIVGKDYVDIEGVSRDKFVVVIEFSTSTSFPSGKHYYDYQPIMWNANSKLSNATAITKNCRYPIHFEGSTFVTNNEENVENCKFIQLGNVDMGGQYQDCIGMGVRDGQTINFKNCEAIANTSAVGIHTALDATVKGATVNFIDCIFDAEFMHFDTYPNERQVNVNFVNPIFRKNTSIRYPNYYQPTSISSDYSLMKIKSNKHILFDNSLTTKGLGLRIKSKSTGVGSIVSVDTTCTAFNSIIGISTLAINVENGNCWNTTYGYFYKNGGVGLSGQIVGGIDIDSGTSHTSLGKKLGDCSSVNKTLTLTVDGTAYNVVFNTNLTSSTNAQVIALITAVIGTVADVDTYSIGREYYPDYDGVIKLVNADTTAILKGMGVIMLANNTMRLALNSDNRIDGVCLDDVAVGSRGRILSKGSIYSYYKANVQRFTITSVQTTTVAIGTEFGISAATPGLFDSTAAPKLLRAIDTDIIKIV